VSFRAVQEIDGFDLALLQGLFEFFAIAGWHFESGTDFSLWFNLKDTD
jgi:hypothetical protein